jgi:xylose isomerase
MAGLNFYHVIAQALEAGKLFHLDLNDQKGCRFDQDLRFGSESIKNMFHVVKLLEESGYDGSRHFDAHAYRSEDSEGVWDFAAGCMRTYLIFKEKARQFNEDKEIQAVLAEIRATDPAFEPIPLAFTKERAAKILSLAFDRVAIGKKRLPYEKLDQLTVDLLLGVR